MLEFGNFGTQNYIIIIIIVIIIICLTVNYYYYYIQYFTHAESQSVQLYKNQLQDAPQLMVSPHSHPCPHLYHHIYITGKLRK